MSPCCHSPRMCCIVRLSAHFHRFSSTSSLYAFLRFLHARPRSGYYPVVLAPVVPFERALPRAQLQSAVFSVKFPYLGDLPQGELRRPLRSFPRLQVGRVSFCKLFYDLFPFCAQKSLTGIELVRQGAANAVRLALSTRGRPMAYVSILCNGIARLRSAQLLFRLSRCQIPYVLHWTFRLTTGTSTARHICSRSLKVVGAGGGIFLGSI